MVGIGEVRGDGDGDGIRAWSYTAKKHAHRLPKGWGGGKVRRVWEGKERGEAGVANAPPRPFACATSS